MPRIRTIKPSFWSHPLMGKLSDSAKCMALALLNFADDEGYFYADPEAVRSFARPFDHRITTTQRALNELSRLGFTLSCQNPTRGRIGRVVHFTRHQSICRPQPSVIKQYWIENSLNDQRASNDDSMLERKGIYTPSPLSPSSKEEGGKTDAFASEKSLQDATNWVCQELGYSGANIRHAVARAIELEFKSSTDEIQTIAQLMVRSRRNYDAVPGTRIFHYSPLKFFEEGIWKGSRAYRERPTNGERPEPVCMMPGCKNPPREGNRFCSDTCEHFAQQLDQKYGSKGSA